MKNIFAFIVSIFTITLGNSQDLIAVQNGNTPSFYKDLSEAIEESKAGDTLYIPGRNYIVNDTINKPIHLIGVGINPNYTQATGITSLTSPGITSPQLILGDNADGGSIVGIHFTTNYYNGNPRNNITQDTDTDVRNYLIDRCYFGSNVSGKFSSSLIKQSIFRHRNAFNAENGNSVITNNVFCDRSNNFTNCIVANNIFLTGLQYYKAMSASSCVIENNVLPFFAFNYVNNCNIRNNINSSNGISGTNIRSGNFSGNIDLTTIFINYTTVTEAIDFTANFRLLEGSEYKESGTDNSDIGIYGGRFPWKDGSIPFIPHIVTKEISGTTDENGNLNIKIEVQAQKN